MTTLHTLDIPQEPAALGRWLEQQLLGLNLASTIAELSAVHGTPVRQQTLEDLLGPHLDSVLTDGLQSLPLPLLQGLLRDPKLLLPLQELICLEGGGYWESETLGPAERTNEKLMTGLRTSAGVALAALEVDPMITNGAAIQRHVTNGHLLVADGRLVLSRAGRLFADRIASDLFVTPHDR